MGWDGTYKGQASPVGMYIYFMRYSPAEKQHFEEKGHITLLR